jgi:ATP-dependent helicase YprA (DUF1998 family)
MVKTLTESISELHNALKEYIEATYHISDPNLVQQRGTLLDSVGTISQEPFIESTPRYVAGSRFEEIAGIPSEVITVLKNLASSENGSKLLHDPPYQHQWNAIDEAVVKDRSLIIMTGTGSGKTESFLLPILARLGIEALGKPERFRKYRAVRALVLYPMNALVNDQLGRLRNLIGDERVKAHFIKWGARVPTFARYTSRTPYPGVRDPRKDASRLKPFAEFYVEIERALRGDDAVEREKAMQIYLQLRDKGKWPAKPSLAEWFGEKGERWEVDGAYRRAITREGDSELITRHEVQTNSPDIMITNYSMLEYMMMRPIERNIFDQTSKWLEENPEEKFVLVLDEAHLYRGAAGAEVGLLIRRLRERLNLASDRFQVICSTASFHDKDYAPIFASKLSGLPPEFFTAITGTLEKRVEDVVIQRDCEELGKIDMSQWFTLETEDERKALIGEFLGYRGGNGTNLSLSHSLYKALYDFPPLKRLANLTMGHAQALGHLITNVFPETPTEAAEKGITTLLALSSLARSASTNLSLYPSRVHIFFRGLPGLWICLNPDCQFREPKGASQIGGKLFSQPRDYCSCGSRVLELYTCRNCGTAHARGYTDNIDNPCNLWSSRGKTERIDDSPVKELYPIDILLQRPPNFDKVEVISVDTLTGRINPRNMGGLVRVAYIKKDRLLKPVVDEDEEEEQILQTELSRGQFVICAVCNKSGGSRGSAIQDHQTKGDQPFLAVLTRQIEIQPPATSNKSDFAPLQGRKVLIFSDSRQLAAKLAPSLQMYSLRDVIRPLIVWGFRKFQEVHAIRQELSLNDCYLAVLVAANVHNIKLRPELNNFDNFEAVNHQISKEIKLGALSDETRFVRFFFKYRNEKAPQSLLRNIINCVSDKFLGLHSLAIASITEKEEYRESLLSLPDIPNFITTGEAKLATCRLWIRCWQSVGYWLHDMPDSWWKPSEKYVRDGVRGHKSGKFKLFKKLFPAKGAQKIFYDAWVPRLLECFTENLGGVYRISGKNLTLSLSNEWVRCTTCSSIQLRVPGIGRCVDCNSTSVIMLNEEEDEVFKARKGYYRRGVGNILRDETSNLPFSLIAAEHTAQLNAPQVEDIFSQAERNELLFQDISIDWPAGITSSTSIDILSSTTTMEVGIDIGALSGVALRNMPPGRANYQQRAGRAGRRGNSVATVMAFGTVDSHDEHYFTNPHEMISGPVVDPILSLDNVDIVKRHVRAFILQRYHQARLPEQVPRQQTNLFSVLGKVQSFVNGEGILNRDDFAVWLTANSAMLRSRLSWILPAELKADQAQALLNDFQRDCLEAIDDATDFSLETTVDETNDELEAPAADLAEGGELSVGLNDNLLDRLLYRGKLPRYAFPTDVATFHVFDVNRSTTFRPVMKFAPSQGLPLALSQYAPDKKVWISNRCYTSAAIYTPIKNQRFEAWQKRRLYYHCLNCGFATTEQYSETAKDIELQCQACGYALEKPTNWLRPPGFAHPYERPEETSPDSLPEISYATRAKLYIPFSDAESWEIVNAKTRSLPIRTHLLVSNAGPNEDGYYYCVKCGRIEAVANATGLLRGLHSTPYPAENNQCDGMVSRVVLGTDFITDVGLFSFRLGPTIILKPGHYISDIALRTVCEALSKAATNVLQIEPNEIMAEFRPALNQRGRSGEEVEVFLYDTLPGGAGFSSILTSQSEVLFRTALSLLETCAGECDSSCYRCLRTFKNKFDHRHLDRYIGMQLLRYIIDGTLPVLEPRRADASLRVLFEDLIRMAPTDVEFKLYDSGERRVIIGKKGREHFNIVITNPLMPNENIPLGPELSGTLIRVNELIVRTNLPAATQSVFETIALR